MKLNSILKSFHKTLRQLDQYIDQVDKDIDSAEQKMAELTSRNFVNRRDRAKAEKTRDKISELIGEEV
ncbi:hypothetical protein GCM10007160_18110 [Litchfieldella qijiaojingensis]|uniref:Uncharacterized protein n=1 Tax=Litchfieldella qijiaojingensis TaxID=980347 RepID=A0ABQ2YS31_9GAMM|nr:hypothetical protein [Halomonas qijiaojingensis]GGX91019.1 hypothetical protein GCM10007160_18110 [Halomonas qijiaojingensis]